MRKFLFAGMGVAAAVVAPGGTGLRMRRPGRTRRRRPPRQGDDVHRLVGRRRALRDQLRLHRRRRRRRVDRAAPRRPDIDHGSRRVDTAASRARVRASRALPCSLISPLRAAGAPAIVIEQVQVEALDVTVLKGSGQAVIDWCTHNGFLVSAEIKNHLLRYASSSRSSWRRNTTRRSRCNGTSRRATACRC